VKNKIINTSPTNSSCDLFKFVLNGFETLNSKQNNTIIKNTIIPIIEYNVDGVFKSGKILLECFK
jgi:hypothetical protein